MNFLRFISILIILTVLLTGCSQKISQIEYDRKNYEHEQLKIRYELLQKEVDGKTSVTTTTNKTSSTSTEVIPEASPSINSDVNSEVNIKEYEELKRNYETLLNQNLVLETAYTELHEQQENQPQEVTPPGTVPVSTYNELKIEKAAIEKRYVILENRYNTLKEMTSDISTSSIFSAEIIEPTEINPEQNISKGNFEREETSIDLGVRIVQSASHNGLFFDFDDYDRTEEYLVLEVAIKNNSQTSLKTFWNSDKIQIIDTDNNTYTAKYFRVGVDYASEVDGSLSKKIKDENTVFARFAFEELPEDFKQIQSLKFIVIIDGEERSVEFTQIDISKIEQ